MLIHFFICSSMRSNVGDKRSEFLESHELLKTNMNLYNNKGKQLSKVASIICLGNIHFPTVCIDLKERSVVTRDPMGKIFSEVSILTRKWIAKCSSLPKHYCNQDRYSGKKPYWGNADMKAGNSFMKTQQEKVPGNTKIVAMFYHQEAEIDKIFPKQFDAHNYGVRSLLYLVLLQYKGQYIVSFDS